MANGVIYSPAAFKANPSLRSCIDGRPKFIWSFLKPAFDWGIAPTDIDGLVERNGNYLLYECKEADKGIPVGQKRMLRDLNVRHGFTVFVVGGFTESTIHSLNVVWPRGEKYESYKNIRSDFLLEKSRQWFNWAEGRRVTHIIERTTQEQTLDEWLMEYERAKRT